MTTQELEVRPSTALQETNAVDLGRDLLAVIARAASDPTVDVAKMERLLNMQMTIMARAAEVSFNNALRSLKARLPRITKNGAIVLKSGDYIKYARYEDIHEQVFPLMSEEGFAVTYTSSVEGTYLEVTGTFRHEDGHQDSGSVFLPMTDDSGAKNRVQGAGSVLSYGKRYVLCQFLDIVTEGDDDDGMQGLMKPISEQQRSEIIDLIADSKCDEEQFLKYMRVSSIDEIVVKDLLKAKSALISKRDARTKK